MSYALSERQTRLIEAFDEFVKSMPDGGSFGPCSLIQLTGVEPGDITALQACVHVACRDEYERSCGMLLLGAWLATCDERLKR